MFVRLNVSTFEAVCIHNLININTRTGLSNQYSGLFRVAVAPDTIHVGNDKPNVKVEPGDRIFASFRNAHRDVSASPLLRLWRSERRVFLDSLTTSPTRSKSTRGALSRNISCRDRAFTDVRRWTL